LSPNCPLFRGRAADDGEALADDESAPILAGGVQLDPARGVSSLFVVT